MRKFTIAAFVLVVGLTFSTVSSAKGHSRPYGMAGCGLWSYVIKDKSMAPQLGVFALRYLFNVQTFAITSGTSNCVPDGSSSAAAEKQVYIAANLTALSKEAAQGGGEHLNSLARVMGCSDQEAFAKMSQQHYSQIFETHDPDVVLEKYEDMAKSCAS